MAVTTKKTFPNAVGTNGQSATVFTPVGIELNNHDDLDVYVTLSGGTRVLQLRQTSGSTAQSSHPQVNNTDGLYFPAVSAGTTLYNYTLSTDNNTITFSTTLPTGAVVSVERRTRDASSDYTNFAGGSTIRSTDLNNAFDESNFTGQEARNKSFELEGALFEGGSITKNFVTSSHIVDGTIATADLANSSVTTDKIADGAVTSAKFNNNAVSTAKIADASVTTAKLADDAVTAAKIADGNVGATQLASNAVTTVKIQDNAVTTAKIANDAVTSDKLANSIVSDITTNNAKVSNVTHTGEVTGSSALTITNNAVVEAKIANNAVTSNKIASNAVTTDKIADGELTTLAGMQSGTASVLADSTALTATTAELNQLDGITLETSVTGNSNTRIPTSKAVNDLVLSVTNALGGFVAIANETSFPTANPDPSNNAGTVVSISQLASGLAVNGSGVATISNGAGTGNTVTITGFPTNLQSQTLPAASGLQVQTTSTLHTYTFHKQLASAADIQAISATVNSFSNRYRVSASAPTSSLDGGDLWFDTTNNKLMVYNSTTTAWEEVTSTGNFFINTLSSTGSGSDNPPGGSATFNGTAQKFALSNPPQFAAQLLVSLNGVIQKPNSGTSVPSEGFAISGTNIIFSSAPPTGADFFIITIGSSVGIGTPSNNTVTTAILQNGSVTTAKIVDSNVTTGKIAGQAVTTGKIANGAVTTVQIGDSSISTIKIQDDAVTAAKLANTSVTAGSYGTASAIPAITVDAQGRITAASTNAVSIPPAVGGSNGVDFNDSVKARFGTGNDLEIFSDGSTTFLKADDLRIRSLGNENYLTFAANGAVTAFYDGSKKFETTSAGVTLVDGLHLDNGTNAEKDVQWQPANNRLAFFDNTRATFGNGVDLQIYHDGSESWIKNSTGTLNVLNDGTFQIKNLADNETIAQFAANGACSFYYDNDAKLSTGAVGVYAKSIMPSSHATYDIGQNMGRWNDIYIADNGKLKIGQNNDLQIYHDGADTRIVNNTGDLYIDTPTLAIRSDGGNEDAIQAIANGPVNLFHNGSKKFETNSTGAEVNGQLRFTENSFLGDTCQIQRHSNYLWYQSPANGHIWRSSGGNNLWRMADNGGFFPFSNNSFDIGTTTNRVRNIYTNDLNLSNEGSSNDVDGTWGDWTIQEGESDLFLKNNRSGKKYKFNLTEVS